jgi:hypothetical protein
MDTKQENGVPNPAPMISRDGEGSEPEQSEPHSHDRFCMGSSYATRYARDFDSTAGVWVLRGTAENCRKYLEVELGFIAQGFVYNKKERWKFVKLAGGVYYESSK